MPMSSGLKAILTGGISTVLENAKKRQAEKLAASQQQHASTLQQMQSPQVNSTVLIVGVLALLTVGGVGAFAWSRRKNPRRRNRARQNRARRTRSRR